MQEQNKEIVMKSHVATLLIRPLRNPRFAMIEDVFGAASLFLLLFVDVVAGPQNTLSAKQNSSNLNNNNNNNTPLMV